jgi:hypothetical protein
MYVLIYKYVYILYVMVADKKISYNGYIYLYLYCSSYLFGLVLHCIIIELYLPSVTIGDHYAHLTGIHLCASQNLLA